MADKQKITLSACSNPRKLVDLLNALYSEIVLIRNAVNEINTWAEATATKLNSDDGVTDADYDAVITAAAVTAAVEKTK